MLWVASTHRTVGRARGLEHMPPQAAKEDTGGEVQPINNHPKLTDSNNCLLFSFSCRLIAFVSTPLLPVSSSVRLRAECRC
jgi:hypothetical protein